MAISFKTIGIIGRVKNPEVKETLTTLVYFLKSLKQTILLESETAESIHDTTLPHVPRNEIGNRCDLLIVIGGDGSLLNTAHAAINSEVPVLGINRGKLGFLTDIHPTELEKIHAILEGKYFIEKRFLLDAVIEHNGTMIGADSALNEVAIIPDMIPHMIEFEIYIDNQFVCSQDSDGLIIATPTGSTAYALSGGGPILHPQLDAIVLVPMFPHSLSSRPIVVEGNSRITVIISPKNKTSPRVTCDGQAQIKAPVGSHISIAKKTKKLPLIHPLDYDYYKTLRSKLHWGKKLQLKEK
ncbi:NAD(+) kinase [Gammaproteobacteria bacterium SCGC AG-212-F23]|nr:NAD(+) kinase [Gammaproteobacteria bacterium SCGC AG-212-F23]